MDVRDIIDALNVEGRQGPQDLLSDECYSWVRARLNITRARYNRIINDNTIDNAARAGDRSACFVRLNNSRVVLFKSNEAELRPYVCYAVDNMQPPVTSARVKTAVKAMYELYTPVDLMPQNNPGGDQARIDQTIRNILVSNYYKQANNRLFNRSENTPYTYSLTPDGKALAETLSAPELENNDGDAVIEAEAPELPDTELENAHNRPVRYSFNRGGRARRPDTDRRLLAAVARQRGYRCAVDPDHITFRSRSGAENFVEGHHLIPLTAQPLFPGINLDCPENIVTLCPNCHSAIHYGDDDVRAGLARRLLDIYRDGLLAIGVDVETLDTLMWTYYKC